MEVEFSNDNLDRLETDGSFNAGLSRDLVRAYRRRMQQLRAARDERDLYNLKSLHFEKLKGDRAGQRSIRLNDMWRLILQVIPGTPGNTLRVCAIEDYH
jgi:toxin HigB-1